jgi:pSer/pThr/pTyr-binding forkhead associated (FHA) protein
VQDLASTNGTMLNDDLLTPDPQRLQDGDVITISPVTITFVSP